MEVRNDANMDSKRATTKCTATALVSLLAELLHFVNVLRLATK